jgi:CRP-like cAMP-binding protein
MLSPPENLLLSSLSTASRDLLFAHSTAIELPLRSTLYEAERTPKFAYFMRSGIASVVTTMVEGGTAEVVVIGREGLVGSLHLLGTAAVQTRCFMQLTGAALRIPLSDLREVFRTSEEIRDRILEFVQQQTLCISQIAGCNRLHGAEERLARWLLMVHDRMDSDVLNLTQEFLAEMLGAQRTTVTMVAGVLQESGLIEYRRGHVRIKNRESLEAAACDCYQVTKRLYAGLYNNNGLGQSPPLGHK